MVVLSYLEIANFPVIILIGIITSYQDLKYRKIKNKWTLVGLIYSILSLLAVTLYLAYKNVDLNTQYITVFFTNILISFALGFFFWLIKLWTAGDAKLFLMYSALVPLSVYEWGPSGNFPAYILLINTFTLIFFIFLFKIFAKIKPKFMLAELKNTLTSGLVFSFAVFIFGFSTIVKILFSLFAIPTNFVLSGIVFLISMLFVKNVLNADFTKIGLILSAIRLIIEYETILKLSFLYYFTGQLLFFLILRYFILNLGHYAFSKKIYIENLIPGMCLAEDITEKQGKYEKKKEVSISFLQQIFDMIEKKSILENRLKLTKNDVKTIKTLHSKGKIKDHIILIYEKIHFALFMFIGVLLTLFFRGNMLIPLKTLLEKFL
ncbi:hypothetical protein GF327_00055 [Candidatus Woesearchaeota archaeon]|nr:hypothetical protein [Candidatus Woesearchaeota archaeon]